MIKKIALAIRAAIPQRARQFLHRVGMFLAPDEASRLGGYRFPSMEASLLCLKNKGFAPKLAVDIGAYHGEWTKMFKMLFPATEVMMVEAQVSKAEQLKKVCNQFAGSVEYRIALLGPSDGLAVEFAEMETGSSVYAEQSHFGRTIVSRHTTTLDRLIGPNGLQVDFLKLDVQGYELEVLRGASGCLQTAVGVLMEVSFLPINLGCPLVAEVIQFMDHSGFQLIDLCSQTRRADGVLWQSDLLFIRTNCEIMPSPMLSPENWK